MKKTISICFCVCLSACLVHTNVQEIKPNEHGISSEFDKRIYTVNCYSNSASINKVKNKCLKKMATVAHEKEYQYFTVLSQNHTADSQIIPVSTTKQITTNQSFSSNAYTYGMGGYANAYGSGSASSTTSVPYTEYYNSIMYAINYMFVLIKEDELNKWANYYKVSDYYEE